MPPAPPLPRPRPTQLAAWGLNWVQPPTDEAGLLAYLGGLPDTQIYEAIRHARPLTPSGSRASASQAAGL